MQTGEVKAIHRFDENNRPTFLKNIRAGAESQNFYTYDNYGNQTEKNENGEVTKYAYDSFNRLIRQEEQIGRVTYYSCDIDGNRKLQTVKQMVFEEVSPPIEEEETPPPAVVDNGEEPPPTTENEENTTPPTEGEAPQPQPTIKVATGEETLISEIEYEYNVAGRLISTTERRGEKEVTTTYSYDYNGNLVSEEKLENESVETVTYSYDNRGRLTRRGNESYSYNNGGIRYTRAKTGK